MRFTPVGELVGVIGRRVTAAAGFFMAGVDFHRAWKETKRDNYKMATCYGLSFAAGLGLTIAILAGSLVWIAGFLVLVIAVTVAMMLWGDNECHAWLDRCLWGKLGDERYPDVATEQREYELAVGLS